MFVCAAVSVTNNRLEGNCRGLQWLWAGPRHHPSIWRWGWIQFDIPVCLCLHHYGLKRAGSDRLGRQVAWCRRGILKLYFRVRRWCIAWTPCTISFCVCSKLCLSAQMVKLVGWNGNLICVYSPHCPLLCCLYDGLCKNICILNTPHSSWLVNVAPFPSNVWFPDQLLSKPQLPACPGRQTPLCCFSVVVLKSMGSKGASSVLFWDLYYAEANATWSN